MSSRLAIVRCAVENVSTGSIQPIPTLTPLCTRTGLISLISIRPDSLGLDTEFQTHAQTLNHGGVTIYWWPTCRQTRSPNPQHERGPMLSRCLQDTRVLDSNLLLAMWLMNPRWQQAHSSRRHMIKLNIIHEAM